MSCMQELVRGESVRMRRERRAVERGEEGEHREEGKFIEEERSVDV